MEKSKIKKPEQVIVHFKADTREITRAIKEIEKLEKVLKRVSKINISVNVK
jgi:uncharacterized protein YutE (UPF0331/DUF86 family)